MLSVIINGVSSETLQGVQILSLPPITKPKMRRTIETVDGRAGDIVTELGFEAYNKTIEILLHHNYDLDAVTAFFNQGGDIIFSNEPTKLYKFTCIEAIDYERAHKFKTAKVTYHVQPFKMDVGEVERSLTSPAEVVNRGNVFSAPVILIYGSGTVAVSLDDAQAFSIDMPSDGYITIDSDRMNAYVGDVLANRSVTGDYENLHLTPGKHTLSWTGTVTDFRIKNISRWI